MSDKLRGNASAFLLSYFINNNIYCTSRFVECVCVCKTSTVGLLPLTDCVYIMRLKNGFAICSTSKPQEFCYNSSHMCSSLMPPDGNANASLLHLIG